MADQESNSWMDMCDEETYLSYDETSLTDEHMDCGSAQLEHECVDGRMCYELQHLTAIPTAVYNAKQSLTELILDYNHLSTICDEFCQHLSSLRILSLLGNKLVELPANIHLLSALQHLSVDNNRITELPDSLCELKSLSKLSIEGNGLKSLPSQINNLKSLRELRLNDNKLESLPNSFGHMASLSELDLSYNFISHLPESFGSLSLLRTLNISNNKLTELAPNFSNLCSVENLELSFNSLVCLPKYFASHSVLIKLYVDNNELSVLPEWIAYMSQIEEISLKANYLKDEQFAESFGLNSQKLIKFDIRGNLMSRLPDSFASINTLQFVDTGSALFECERKKNLKNGNNIRLLPKQFGLHYACMRELRLDESHIEELPQCFGDRMPNLEILNLYYNKLQVLPHSFCKLNKLRVLFLAMNSLKKLPQDFGNLTSLEELRLEFNELRSFPLSFGRLVNLRVLNIYNNKFTAFPSVLTKLENIKSLQTDVQISDMVIAINPSHHLAIDRLKRSLNFGALDRNQTYSWKTVECDSLFSVNKSLNSRPSSSYSSLLTSQNQMQDYSEEESWDSDQFDPQRPYLYEPIIFPNSHFFRLIPTDYTRKNILKSLTNTSKIYTKKLNLTPIDGQFDDDF